MQRLSSSLLACMLLLLASVCKANEVANTIFVDKSGKGNFTAIQKAIDSIPQNNTEWIRIQISADKYSEKVVIPANKPFIFLEGAGRNNTSIEYGDDQDLPTSATFISYADNIKAEGITIKNTYNLQNGGQNITMKRATAIRIQGDKSAFYDCAFVGIQDTFFDDKGSHYFKNCYIEGAIDFIYGSAQSIYEECVISLNVGKYDPGLPSSITAQKKAEPEDPSGFVFKNCEITGTGKAHLGRAWGPYSTVIIYNSTISDIILPQGWNAWHFVGHEENFTYVEANNTGAGADTSRRVPWLKKFDASELSKFVDLSYIDRDGWIEKLPTTSLIT
ncbi:hypothetical protein MANES_05G013700v8 [Manihot esculenta]|uniref:pectinesterase n=1 Tax=Manihot esculenta TaxID=3983 RepID=A0A2C9VSE6_MANES|nr:hypothetical protein MANES_05G013700v8 [Manihot esculenta]